METMKFYKVHIWSVSLMFEDDKYLRHLKQVYEMMKRVGAIDYAYSTFTLKFKEAKKRLKIEKVTHEKLEWRTIYTIEECKLELKP